MQPCHCIGVVTGLAFEADVIRRRVRYEGLADKILVRAGLGREKARRAAEALLADGANALLSFGIAGGLDPSGSPETTIVATAVKAADMPTLTCETAWSDRMAKTLGVVRRGDLADAAAILKNATEKADLFRATAALAADMESYGVGEAALAAKVPFAALRVIADTANDDLPEIALHALAPEGSLKLRETLGHMLKSPAQIPDLLRLGRATARAHNRLDRLAAVGVGKLFSAFD